MATSKEYRDYVLEQLRSIEGISCKPMMGEYLLYNNNLLFGGIYDNRVLVKKTASLSQMDLPSAIPYDGAKEMYEIDIEETQKVSQIISLVCEDLKKKA